RALSCEFYVGDTLHKGSVLDLDATGFFVHTDAEVEPGAEVELKLAGQPNAEPVYLRAVVEKIVVPSELAHDKLRGIWLRVLELRREYSALISAVRSPSPDGSDAADDGLTNPLRSRSGEREWLSDLSGKPREPREPRANPPQSPDHSIDRSKWENEVSVFERAGEPLWSETPPAPDALVIDDGEVDDVVAILQDLGVDLQLKTPSEVGNLSAWVPPNRLLVLAAERALALRLPLSRMPRDAVSIAITDSTSKTVGTAIQRLGYRYIVRRPVHPLALRMLLSQGLCPDAGNRSAPRAAYGGEVSWRVGWRRRRGAIIDVSSDGCLLFATKRAEVGCRLKIRFPAQIERGRAFTVEGRVMRCMPVAQEQVVLGVQFESNSVQVAKRIQDLLAALTSGPPRQSQGSSEPIESLERRREGEPQVQRERRQGRRAAVRKEIVALDPETQAVKYTLIGRDLSVEGIRVEAHPSLVLNEPVYLALYDSSDSEPLTLYAVVARIDGSRGCWLRFPDLGPAARERVVQAIADLPSVERLDEPEPVWLMQGQVDKNPSNS
ncbi:MAG: PilZ domain-containing protein, partial [Myxococcota bacterium]